ncbi:hypothetical protein SNE25_21190 [Mucilaginibacter sabulilitoris]|jgi:hypothetical protein|uniref:Uncharacterized protein n=1 Tax=Mucilaginibacter sabulilitoris TaxID=1173583 RepID=A0ABZ0TGY0_9SPHI|nr:hypothetical protein [Mucilaginibacter sabulilitoris]WPU91836.1 hypothetical protein SNE25_21190 [Mucilaginibacter sabulilitoris]
MAQNKLTDLRNHLFATLEGLLDEEAPMDIQRANAVAQVGSVIVQSAKVEVDYAKVMGKLSPTSDFIENTKQLNK